MSSSPVFEPPRAGQESPATDASLAPRGPSLLALGVRRRWLQSSGRVFAAFHPLRVRSLISGTSPAASCATLSTRLTSS